jgi:hypothetical protein
MAETETRAISAAKEQVETSPTIVETVEKTDRAVCSEKKKVSFKMVTESKTLPDINPIIAWFNVEMSKIGLKKFKLNTEFFEQDYRNRDKLMRLSNDFQIHQYEDNVYFQELDLKEQTPENIATKLSLVQKKSCEQQCHYLFNIMTISDMNLSMCLVTMEQFEKLRRFYSTLLGELDKKYRKIQKSFDVSAPFEKMLEWKQHMEPITNNFEMLQTEINKNSQMLIMHAGQYEQLKLAHVINRHNYDRAMNYLDLYYPRHD